MAKKLPYNVMSETKRCSDCGKALKRRLEDNVRCYRCHCLSEAMRGHTINSKPRMKRLAGGLPVKVFKHRVAV